nr:RNA-directed DNA polymerase, eukaryota, reverse transcriptase zinc-binding domain protein [Tanacetum cinerariifolium]
FNTDGRVTWVEIKGVPLKMWSKNTFNRVASKWGVLLDVDDQEDKHFHMKRILPNGEDVKNVEDLEGDSDGEIVPDTKFEEDFQNQKGEEDSIGGILKYPPGYTPTGSKEATGEKQFDLKKNSKNDVEESICSGHFKKSEVPKSGGSILQLIDNLVKVGETIGAYVGNSVGILCVWDPNMFKKTNSTVLDYFVMVRGDWMPNGKKLLIISVYAPQELYEKKIVWDYLSLVMSNWEGEVPFRFFHYWFEVDGFDKLIKDSWKDAPIIESNVLVRMMKKLKYLKEKIRVWNKLNKEKSHKSKRSLLAELADCDAIVDKEKKNSLEAAQKAKIKWAIEGDENSKYYHVSKEEIKRRCGIDKSSGPDGFTFGFYRRYWKLIENDVVDAMTCFFHQGLFPKGGNSSFIILIPKTPNSNMVKDYMPISLIGSMYKTISKILANRLVVVLGGLVNEI